MPSSTISHTLRKYRESLDVSSNRERELYEKRSKNVGVLYEKFLKNLIRRYPEKISDKKWLQEMLTKIKKMFDKKELTFVAVDGSSDKVQLEEYSVFFAASYGVKGSFNLNDGKSVYIKRDLKDELSMVAYVPIPFAELGDVTGGEETNDEQRFTMINIHNKLMILAEIYLIFKEASSEDHPDIILWDQTFSGMFHWTAPSVGNVPMVNNGYSYKNKILNMGDVLVVRSHPYNEKLDVPAPSKGYFNMPNRIIYELMKSKNNEVSISFLSKLFGENEDEVTRVVEKFLMKYSGIDTDLIDFDKAKKIVKLKEKYKNSWDFAVELADTLCKEIFIEKNVEALIYNNKWITTEDIDFLTSIMIRKICELSWEKKILLIGVVKDSASKYFTRNYIGVMCSKNFYKSVEQKDLLNLLWTDRLSFEFLPNFDENLNAPWSSVEYDSVFQILFLPTKSVSHEVMIRDIATSERIFARSLAMLWSMRSKGRLIFNHLLFIDRILVPDFDYKKCDKCKIGANAKEIPVTVKPFTDFNQNEENIIQDLVMYFLKSITTNKYPDVIGYPEPLHRADLGAKTFNRMVQPMIRSSTSAIKTRKPWMLSVRKQRKFR